jgi:pimeloyl-ACP methyl ester carboxylesterase
MKRSWKRVVHPFRKKRARDNPQPTADTQQLTLTDATDSAHSQSQSASAVSSTQRAPTPPATATLTSLLDAPGQRNDNRTVSQRRQKLGLSILYEPTAGLNATVDIVFVHGLTGDSHDTWFHRDENSYWPGDLLPWDMPYARILSFGYDANIVGWWSPASVNRVGHHADALLGAVVHLREQTDSEQRKTIFVMHSLGGLVVQSALDLSRSSPDAHLQNIEANTIGLAFLGTPHFGADKASWGGYGAKLLSLVKETNKHIVQVLEPDSEMLAMIQKKFHGILRTRSIGRPIDVTCFYEEVPLPVLGLVSKLNHESTSYSYVV